MNDFVVDKPGRYRTRDNSAALVFLDDGHDVYPIIGALNMLDGYSAERWHRNGRYCEVAKDRLDIIEYLGPLRPGDDGFGGKE